ncbi:glycosyltransferase family 4 protein [Bacillus cytotoxicus]|uniref:Glycosyltransferase family 4 protein n=1 Tax=Bacillus cytotoxicus TaxID=580165 RepID=A0ACC6A4U3_9BACI|nr:glycosyltransferase family 4 protein [Bacillus cytotoxicus]HDX9579056.1 glycosyltransferase family 4 protein [Bacillus pseudomycoides]
MKKDVLIMCQYFYPEYVSSATLPTELAEDLVEKGLSVDVLCGYPKEYYEGEQVSTKEDYKGVNISRVKYTEFNNKSKFGRIINFFSFFIAILLRLPSLFKYKCVLVYSNPPILPLVPYLISRISKTKFIFVAFDIYPDNALKLGAIKKGGMIEKLMLYINRKVYTYASGIVALGNEMRNYMIKQKIAIKPEKIKVIPNWYSEKKLPSSSTINNEEFRELREKWPFIVLYSGNMGTAQDMDTILQCISRLKKREDVLFLFTGHGNKVNYVKEYLISNEVSNAKVYGFLLGTDYTDVLKIADVCLVSLAEGIEGIGVPSKTYGYLAAGKPVLAIMSDETDIAKNLYEYNAGGSVKQGDAERLEMLITKYMDSKDQLKVSGNNARKMFEDLYERRICTGMYYSMIVEMINEK